MEGVIPVVEQDLRPRDEAKSHENLRLHLERDIEVLGNRIHPEREAACGMVRSGSKSPQTTDTALG